MVTKKGSTNNMKLEIDGNVHLIVKYEEIGDGMVFVVCFAPRTEEPPYSCMKYYPEFEGSDAIDDVSVHDFYAEALADLYARIADQYPERFERRVCRDAKCVDYETYISDRREQ